MPCPIGRTRRRRAPTGGPRRPGALVAALGNELRQDAVQRYTVRGAIREVIEPLLAIEEFSVTG